MVGGRRVVGIALVSILAGLGAAVVVLAVRGVVLGQTLASGEDWRIVARWTPFGSSVVHEHPRGSGGAGGLANQGLLSETMTFRPEDDEGYVTGVVPEDAATVRVTTTAGETVLADVERVLFVDFYIATIDAGHHVARLEAVDDAGEPVGHHEFTDAPSLDEPE